MRRIVSALACGLMLIVGLSSPAAAWSHHLPEAGYWPTAHCLYANVANVYVQPYVRDKGSGPNGNLDPPYYEVSSSAIYETGNAVHSIHILTGGANLDSDVSKNFNQNFNPTRVFSFPDSSWSPGIFSPIGYWYDDQFLEAASPTIEEQVRVKYGTDQIRTCHVTWRDGAIVSAVWE